MSSLFDFLRRRHTAAAALLLMAFAQASSLLHVELIEHADDEHCELCIAQEKSSAALPATGSFPTASWLAVFSPTATPGLSLASTAAVVQPRGPPALSF